MQTNQSYHTYLDSQEVESYPNNRNLRGKSSFQSGSSKQYQYQQPYSNLKIQSSKKYKNSNTIDPQRSNAYEFPSIQRQRLKTTNQSNFEKDHITIPYNTQELNRNVSKVLSDIEQIQSEFRRISSQNSLSLKGPRYYQQDEQNRNKSGFLDNLMRKIKRPINYEQKNDTYIQKQKIQLVKLLKSLNKKLNQNIKQNGRQKEKSALRQSALSNKLQHRRRIRTEADSQTRSSAMQFQKSHIQVEEEINKNQKLIQNMKIQLDFMGKKYQNYLNSLKNHQSIQNCVGQVKDMIKRKKQEISRLRKKKFLRQKSLMNIEKSNGNVFILNQNDILSTKCSTSTHSSSIIVSLKEEYSQLLKKKAKTQDKIQLTKMHLNRIEQLKDKNNVNKEHYDELMEEMIRLSLNDDNSNCKDKSFSVTKPKHSVTSQSGKVPQQTETQHIQFIYKSRKSKLQLLMSTVKRNQQSQKRKYYKLLKEYESLVEREAILESQIPEKPLCMSNIYKQQDNLVEDKLDKSRTNILELENKIKRFGKVGKIIRKVFHYDPDSSNNNLLYQDELLVDYSQKLENDSSKQSPPTYQQALNPKYLMYKKSAYSPNSNTSPFQGKHLSSKQTQRNHEDILAPLYAMSQLSEVELKGITFQSDGKQSSFMTEGDRSLSQIHVFLQKPFRNSLDNRSNHQRKRYIGKFKKQRIVQKLEKKKQQPSKTPQQKQNQNIAQTSPQQLNKRPIQKQNQPIIEEHIQETIQEFKAKLNKIKSEEVNQVIVSYEQSEQWSPERQSELFQMRNELNRQQKQQQIKLKFSKILFKSKIFNQ